MRASDSIHDRNPNYKISDKRETTRTTRARSLQCFPATFPAVQPARSTEPISPSCLEAQSRGPQDRAAIA